MNSHPQQTFSISDSDYPHIVGDARCTAGWCDGGLVFSLPCKCGGLIHADFGDENADGDYWLYEKCDKCGSDYEPR